MRSLSASTVAACVTLCLLSSCDWSEEVEGGASRLGVHVTGLELETSRPDGADLIVRADRGRFESLPGECEGELEEVELTFRSVRGEITRAEGVSARLGEDGSLVLIGATVITDGANLRISAGTVSLDPSGGLEAHRVEARMRAR